MKEEGYGSTTESVDPAAVQAKAQVRELNRRLNHILSPSILTTYSHDFQLQGTAICQFICTLPLYIYAIYVGKKFAKDGNKQCKEDALWLFVFGISSIIIQFFSMVVPFLDPRDTAMKVVASSVGCMALLMLGWAIYGIELFFTNPICPQKEGKIKPTLLFPITSALTLPILFYLFFLFLFHHPHPPVHLFGKIGAWGAVVIFCLMGLVCICVVPILLMTGSMGQLTSRFSSV